MRVLVVTTWLPTISHPCLGAFVIKDARAIADLGHEVALIHLVPQGQLGGTGQAALAEQPQTIQGLPVTRILMSTTNPRQIAAAGHRLARWSTGADLVHTMAFSTLLPMAWWRPIAPWVHTEHWSGLTAPHLLPRAWRAVLPALRPLLARPDVVTVVCDYLAAPIRAIRGTAPTLVVPCIVPAPDRLAERREIGNANDAEIRIVSVGGLIDRKDPLMAIDTVAELSRRGVRSSLRFVGDGPLATRIVEYAEQCGMSEHVTLVGSLDRGGVLDELADADLFLGPTRGDNFFVSCAEAVLSGRPVVVGATGGQGEYLDKRVGICVKEQTPQAYADAVQQVLAQVEGMSAAEISDTIGDVFGAPKVASGYQRAYDLAAIQASDGER